MNGGKDGAEVNGISRLFLLFSILVIASYLLSPITLPFLPFLIISPLLYNLRKLMGYAVVFLWYLFLWILYFISCISNGLFELMSAVLLMATVYIHGAILLRLRDYVSRYYSAAELWNERAHVFFIGLAFIIIAFILAMITVPIPPAIGKDEMGYVLIFILLTAAIVYAVLNFLLKINEIRSEIARDTILLIFVLGMLILIPAHMMGFSDGTAYYSRLPLLIYSGILVSIGGALTMVVLQAEH